MKPRPKFIATAAVLGVLALFVGTSRAGGITPVPKILTVTEQGTIVSTNSNRNSETVFPDPPPDSTSGRVATGFGFRSLALDRRTALNPSNSFGLKIYIADAGTGTGDGRILRVEIVPGPNETAEALFVTLPFPSGIAFDQNKDLLYWSDKMEGKIYRTNVTGNPLVKETVVSGLLSPRIVRICTEADRSCGQRDRIYWTEPGANRIGRATLSALTPLGAATAAEDLVTGLTAPVGLSIGRDRVYWTDIGTDKIGRADLGGPADTNKNTGFVDNVTESVGVSLGFQRHVPSPKQMFWTFADAVNGMVKHRDIDDDLGPGSDFSNTPVGLVTDIRVLRPGRFVPTISTWGVVILLLLVIAAGTVIFRPVRATVS